VVEMEAVWQQRMRCGVQGKTTDLTDAGVMHESKRGKSIEKSHGHWRIRKR